MALLRYLLYSRTPGTEGEGSRTRHDPYLLPAKGTRSWEDAGAGTRLRLRLAAVAILSCDCEHLLFGSKDPDSE